MRHARCRRARVRARATSPPRSRGSHAGSSSRCASRKVRRFSRAPKRRRFDGGRNVHPAQAPMLAARMQTQTFERSPWRMLLATLGLAGFGATPALAADGGLMKDVTFGDYGAAASSSELARRVLTPLAFERIKPHLSSA